MAWGHPSWIAYPSGTRRRGRWVHPSHDALLDIVSVRGAEMEFRASIIRRRAACCRRRHCDGTEDSLSKRPVRRRCFVGAAVERLAFERSLSTICD